MPIEPVPAQPLPKKLQYLALGDSYTIGQSVGEKERFPFFVSSMLRDLQVAINDPKYIARTGWSTIALQAAISAENPPGTFDIVSLLIGVNDQYQGLDTAGYRIRFTQLLASAIQLAGNKKSNVFVLSIPDYSVTPYVASGKARVSSEIESFNSINKDITTRQGIVYVDITPSTREAGTDASLLADDGLHYSAKEHRRWAEKLAPLIKVVL
ncbi:MAG TPA: SGNH/GDSL hydrolase family protein [Chitinophagaceae bacterium]|nr:SGNH/GDSL hydrolase family protein [Chitinophagaceae bacterium]